MNTTLPFDDGASSSWPSPISSPFVDPSFLALKSVALGCLCMWTIAANLLVFIVLYENPRLQTVPNLLVGNLAFSDLCLGIIVLPLSAVYAVTLNWPFGKLACEVWISTDILSCTASIWNLSMIGLDRYWAITSPITYITKRNIQSAILMILAVWGLSGLISLAPFLGWRQYSEKGNFFFDNKTLSTHCQFLELPAYTLYSATGSFYIPLLVMLFVYFQIYRAFADHKARQIYRQKVIKKHIESTILHEISHILPTSDEFAKEQDDEDEEEEDEEAEELKDDNIIEDDEDDEDEELGEKIFAEKNESIDSGTNTLKNFLKNRDQMTVTPILKVTNRDTSSSGAGAQPEEGLLEKRAVVLDEKSPLKNQLLNRFKSKNLSTSEKNRLQFAKRNFSRHQRQNCHLVTSNRRANQSSRRDHKLTYERVQRHKLRKEKRATLRASLQKKPPAISAAKERRGVKVLGIILGCFTVCWFPFFVMYLVIGFCPNCHPNAHIEQFITWLGYSNSAMNPIIYTVFNRDYQIALKKLFSKIGSSKHRNVSRNRRTKV